MNLKPVWPIYNATLRSGGTPQVTECRFSGKPQEIVAAAVRKALNLSLEALH